MEVSHLISMRILRRPRLLCHPILSIRISVLEIPCSRSSRCRQPKSQISRIIHLVLRELLSTQTWFIAWVTVVGKSALLPLGRLSTRLRSYLFKTARTPSRGWTSKKASRTLVWCAVITTSWEKINSTMRRPAADRSTSIALSNLTELLQKDQLRKHASS